MHKIFFNKKFVIFLHMFRALCAHHQEVKIVLNSIWYHHTCRWPSHAQIGRVLSQPVHLLDVCTVRFIYFIMHVQQMHIVQLLDMYDHNCTA